MTGLSTGTTTISGHYRQAVWRITIPTFSGAPVAKEVNRRVRAAANDLIVQVKRDARGDQGTERTLTGQGTVTNNDGRTAQVTIIFTNYLAGTAHPTSSVTTTVIDIRRSRPVLLSEVTQNPPEALRFFRTQVIKVARKQGEEVETAGLSPKLSNWAAWQTTPAGMTFHFGDHQLGGHGLRHYTIPWSQAKLVLSEYGENLLGPR